MPTQSATNVELETAHHQFGTGPDAIEVRDLARRFGEVQALAGVTLSIHAGEFFSLLGPSGCGKTTLLRLIAGLDFPDRGRIRIAGGDMDRVPAHARPVNTVFQSYALFPHLNVFDNVAFGLRMKRVPKPDLDRRVGRVMELVEIAALSRRRPAELSGGQKQRVALARALVNEPQVLLLDEPLGALDLKLRRQLQVELRQLQRRLNMTFIHVTHDQDEALALSDRIAIMRAGVIEQMGAPAQLYEAPRTRFVAQFVGSCNTVSGAVLGSEAGDWMIETAWGRLRVPARAAPSSLKPSARVCIGIRPEKVLVGARGGGVNRFPAAISGCSYAGAASHYQLRLGGETVEAIHSNSAALAETLAVGQTVTACFPPEALLFLEE